MASVRPLRELLADLVGDATVPSGDGYLAEHGHDLPQELVAEAVVNFADTAPPELAEQLAPFVTAHTTGQATDWFDALTSAQPGLADDPDDVLDDSPRSDDYDPEPDGALDFGAGAVDALDFADSPVEEDAAVAAPTTNWPASEQALPDTGDSGVLADEVGGMDELGELDELGEADELDE